MADCKSRSRRVLAALSNSTATRLLRGGRRMEEKGGAIGFYSRPPMSLFTRTDVDHRLLQSRCNCLIRPILASVHVIAKPKVTHWSRLVPLAAEMRKTRQWPCARHWPSLLCRVRFVWSMKTFCKEGSGRLVLSSGTHLIADVPSLSLSPTVGPQGNIAAATTATSSK